MMKKYTLLLLVLALAALLAVCFAGCKPEETPEPPVMEAYWNIDGAEYFQDGVSTRTVTEKGYYEVQASHKAKVVTLKVKADQELINKIDSMRIFGVVLDESKVVVGVKTVEDMGGKIVYDGYSFEAGDYFEMNAISPEGVTVNLKTPTRSAFLLDLISDPEKPQRSYPDKLIRGDKIVAVQDYAGNITDVYVYEAGLIRSGRTIYCPHCCKEGETVLFKAWTQRTSAVLESGHFFLYEDWELADQLAITKNVEFVLDLWGYSVFVVGDRRVCAVNGANAYLGLMDSSEEQTGKFVANSDTYGGKGTVVWISGENATFELYSGTLDGSICNSSAHGSCVNVNGLTGTFRMYGGTILGGTTYNKLNEETGKYSGGGHGGAVCNNGTFIMYGGTITGGKAECNGSGTGRGGNVAIMNKATFEMYGGEIYGGQADNPDTGADEGDLYKAKGSIVKLEGGTIGKTETETQTPAE